MDAGDSKTRSQTRFGRFAERYVASPSHAAGWDLDTLIRACKASGFEAVELRTTHAHKVEPSLSADDRREVHHGIDVGERRVDVVRVAQVGPAQFEAGGGEDAE